MADYASLYISIPFGLYFIALGLGIATLPSQFQGKKYVAVLGLLIVLGGLAGAYSNVQASKADLAANYVNTTLGNNELPLQIDELTTMTAVMSEGAMVIIDFGLAMPDGQEFSDLVASIEANARENACSDPSFKTVLTSGVSIVMRYSPSDGAAPIPFELPAELCGG